MRKQPFEALKGKTLTEVKKIDDERIEFIVNTGEKYAMFHKQDCCESVVIEDICGDLSDLIGEPILFADESSNQNDENKIGKGRLCDESNTWTFYRIGTIKGSVVIRWHGTSNGYYSESVGLYLEVRSNSNEEN